MAKNTDQERCKTETFRIVRKDSQWKLSYNNAEHVLNSLHEVAHFIQADSPDRYRIPASKYDKPPLLLLLLPKNLKAKKTDLQLSEAELQRRNPQIFNPKTDLQWYPGEEQSLLYSLACTTVLSLNFRRFDFAKRRWHDVYHARRLAATESG